MGGATPTQTLQLIMTKAVKKRKKGAGRPTVFTEKVVQDLVAAFQEGLNDTLACQYAGVGRTAFYDHLNKDPEFANTIAHAKNFLVYAAGLRIKKALREGSDRDVLPIAKWLFERRIPEMYTEQKENIIINNQIEYQPPKWFQDAELVEPKQVEGETKQ